MSINWQLFPRSLTPNSDIYELVSVFEAVKDSIASPDNKLTSNHVLAKVRSRLNEIGYEVENSGPPLKPVRRPVLYGTNGSIEQYFDVDACHPGIGMVVEVEAGRGVVNNHFLRDLFKACAIQDARYLCIAVANAYQPKSAKTPARDFATVTRFLDTLFASGRLQLPLAGVLVIGY